MLEDLVMATNNMVSGAKYFRNKIVYAIGYDRRRRRVKCCFYKYEENLPPTSMKFFAAKPDRGATRP